MHLRYPAVRRKNIAGPLFRDIRYRPKQETEIGFFRFFGTAPMYMFPCLRYFHGRRKTYLPAVEFIYLQTVCWELSCLRAIRIIDLILSCLATKGGNGRRSFLTRWKRIVDLFNLL